MKIAESFSARLSLYVTLIAAAVFLVAFGIFFFYARQLVEQEAIQRAGSLLSNTVQRIDNTLHAVEVAVDNSVWAIGENLSDPDSMYAVTQRFLVVNPVVVGCAVAFEPYYYRKKGVFFSPYSYRSNNIIKNMQLGTDDYEYHYMDWYQIPKLLKRSYWSEPYFDAGGGNMVMSTYSKPLYDKEGKLYAVFKADISLEWLTQMVNNIKAYPHSYNLMTGKGGTFIVHHEPQRILNETIFTRTLGAADTTIRYIGEQMVGGMRGTQVFRSGDTLSYICYAPVKSTGWSVAVVCPHKDVFAGVYKLLTVVSAIVGTGLVLLLLFCIHTIKYIARPLKLFARSAVNVAEGDFKTPLPEIRSRDEMWQLRQSFYFMQRSLVKYIEELKITTSNKERIESELRIASEIQMGMIPKNFPPFPDRNDIDLYAVLIPAKEVGGDLYDFFISHEKLYLIIGDVSGKGVPASLLMAVTRSLFRTIAPHLDDPVKIVEALNNSISETNESNMFVTLFVGVFDLTDWQLAYCNAGHNPPVLITPDGKVAFMEVHPNLPVGLFHGFAYKGQEMRFLPGSRLFMYTDGLTEAENLQQELYSEERLLQEIGQVKNKSSQEITLHVMQQVQEFATETEQSDDLTIFTLYYQPS